MNNKDLHLRAAGADINTIQPPPIESVERVIQQAGTVLLGKQKQIQLAVACLLARGHLLIEDLPGMGKTLLSHTLARLLGLHFNRIQFTSDLLPADIIGVSIFDKNTNDFRFTPGPVFTEVLLADEINRATPKSQSALLEAMEEHQVTVDGECMALSELFFVIATQNPSTQTGTYPLPESQLDRFLMRIELGYPDPVAERELLQNGDQRPNLRRIQPILDPSDLLSLQAAVDRVHASDYLLDYVQRLIERSRHASEFATGLSPRGALALLQASRAWALLNKRNHVIPQDIQAVFPSVVAHRLRSSSGITPGDGSSLSQLLLDSVDVVSA